MEFALFFGAVQLLSVELLEAAVLFDTFLQICFVLRRDVLDLFVQSVNLYLAQNKLLLQLLLV